MNDVYGRQRRARIRDLTAVSGRWLPMETSMPMVRRFRRTMFFSCLSVTGGLLTSSLANLSCALLELMSSLLRLSARLQPSSLERVKCLIPKVDLTWTISEWSLVDDVRST